MPVESAADRAALFSEDEFAEAAVYVSPDGAVVRCTIIYDRGRATDFEVEMGNGGVRQAILDRHAEILVDQVPVVEINGLVVPGRLVNGTFVVGPDTLKILTKPRLDETGEIWSVDLQVVPS